MINSKMYDQFLIWSVNMKVYFNMTIFDIVWTFGQLSKRVNSVFRQVDEYKE